MTDFWRAYLKSTRPYTFFITGTAGLCGILSVGGETDALRAGISLFLLFSAYGINQVVNDLLGVREDHYNKVRRPSITGEMDKNKAWLLTGAVFVLGGIVTFFLNPYALAVYVAGYSFNVIYEKMKAIPLLGNLWFGAMISLAPLYGAISTTGMTYSDAINEIGLLQLMLIIMLVQSGLCYFTYFKDYTGDRKAGKITLVALLGPGKARYLNILIFPIPFAVFMVQVSRKLWDPSPGIISVILIGASFLAYLFMVITLMMNRPSKRKPLEMNFQAAVLFQNGLIAMFYPVMGGVLGIASFIIIASIFHVMYRKGFYG